MSLREPPARSYGFAQHPSSSAHVAKRAKPARATLQVSHPVQPPSSSRPTSRNVKAGASDADRDSHPEQPTRMLRLRNLACGILLRAATARAESVVPATSRNVQAGASDAAQVSHPVQPTRMLRPRNLACGDSSARSYGFAQAPSSSRPTPRNVKAGTSDAAQVSHPAQPMPSAQTLQAGPGSALLECLDVSTKRKCEVRSEPSLIPQRRSSTDEQDS